MADAVKTVYEGKLTAEGLKFGIVCSRFNEFFTSKLLEGAVDCIVRHGGAALGFGGIGGGHGLPRRDKARDDVREVGAFFAFERGPEGGALGGADEGFQDGRCGKCVSA